MATIQGIYIALFGRPADPAGLAFFSAQTNNGQNLAGIGNLAGQPEYLNRFTGLSNEQIIVNIYQSLFERTPSQSEINTWLQLWQTQGATINDIAIRILDGAKNADLTTVNAKIASANLFTASLDLPEEVAAYRGATAAQIGRDFINNVDPGEPPATQAETDAAIARLFPDQGGQPGGNPGGNPGGGDTTPPNAPTFTVVVNNDNDTASVSGTAPGATSVQFTVDGQPFGEPIPVTNGAFSFGPVQLPQGIDQTTFQVTATARDAAGNVSAASAPQPVVIDTLAPNAPTFTVVVNNDNDTASVSGTAPGATSVQFTVDGQPFGEPIPVTNGAFSFGPVQLPQGIDQTTFQVTATARDAAGNVSAASAPQPVVIDTQDPAITNLEVDVDAKTVGGNTEPGATVVLTFNGSFLGNATVDPDGKFSFTYVGDLPADDTYTVGATATDKAGNVATASVQVKIDEMPNVITVSDTAPNVDGTDTFDIFQFQFSAPPSSPLTIDGFDRADGDQLDVSRIGFNKSAYDFFAGEGGNPEIIDQGDRGVTVTANSITIQTDGYQLTVVGVTSLAAGDFIFA